MTKNIEIEVDTLAIAYAADVKDVFSFHLSWGEWKNVFSNLDQPQKIEIEKYITSQQRKEALSLKSHIEADWNEDQGNLGLLSLLSIILGNTGITGTKRLMAYCLGFGLENGEEIIKLGKTYGFKPVLHTIEFLSFKQKPKLMKRIFEILKNPIITKSVFLVYLSPFGEFIMYFQH